MMTVEGKIYGLPDDGDALVLYYRKDIFEEPANQQAFRVEYGYDLTPPTTWDQFAEIGQFITAQYAPGMYGAGLLRQSGNAQYMFQERFRTEGGRFFNPETMAAEANSEVGVKILEEMRAENEWMPPGGRAVGLYRGVQCLSLGRGRDDDVLATGRPLGCGLWQGQRDAELAAGLPAQVVDKVGYALTPGGHPKFAVGFLLSLSSDSKNKEAAICSCSG